MSSRYGHSYAMKSYVNDWSAQALLSDGWTSDPFVLTHDKKTDRLYGRGSSDDKGPLLGWINVLEAHQALGIELPVNLRICFEGEWFGFSGSVAELSFTIASRQVWRRAEARVSMSSSRLRRGQESTSMELTVFASPTTTG
jgi:hypothetical protein